MGSIIRNSGPSLVDALERLDKIRKYDVVLLIISSVLQSRIASLARFASRAKAAAISRLPKRRRLATLVAFIQTLEASALDDALDILNNLLNEIFGKAIKTGHKARLRSIRDLDAAAMTLADACRIVINPSLPDTEVRAAILSKFPSEKLAETIESAYALIRPPDDVFYSELESSYRRVRLFLPALLKHIHFSSTTAEKPLVEALTYLKKHYHKRQFDETVPLSIVNKTWHQYVISRAWKKNR